jgi:hypothetical protein
VTNISATASHGLSTTICFCPTIEGGADHLALVVDQPAKSSSRPDAVPNIAVDRLLHRQAQSGAAS